jgi:threonine/homoserine efflux transporter RhtA
LETQQRRQLAIALAVAYVVFLLLGAISLLAHFFVGVVLWVALGVALLVLTYVIVRRPRPSN